MQVTRSLKQHFTRHQNSAVSQLAICMREPQRFRSRLLEHVAIMEPLGFNAHALGVMAACNLHLFLAAPQALKAQYNMLRDVFGSCADEPDDDIRHTDITPACLPATAHDVSITTNVHQTSLVISCLHKACLAGPINVMQWSRWRLEQHLHNLVAAGLFADGAAARHACMQESRFLCANTLRWLLERKAAVLAAGGTPDDVRAVCCITASMQRVVKGLLLWQRARYVCTSQKGVRVKQCRLQCQDTPRHVQRLLDTARLYVAHLLCLSADRLCPCSTRSPTSRRSTQPTTRAESVMANSQRLASTWPQWMDRLSCKRCKSVSKRACKRS